MRSLIIGAVLSAFGLAASALADCPADQNCDAHCGSLYERDSDKWAACVDECTDDCLDDDQPDVPPVSPPTPVEPKPEEPKEPKEPNPEQPKSGEPDA